MQPTNVRLTIPDTLDPRLLMGPADSLLRRIEAAFDAQISVRGTTIFVTGHSEVVSKVTEVFSRLIQMVEAGDRPTTEDIDFVLGQVMRGSEAVSSGVDESIMVTARGRVLRPKTKGQKCYVEAIKQNTITFAIGPAGTGKSYLAMAMAISALKRHELSRIVLVRPVVEAGESLGYLPGTLEEKLDPYIRPLYDALYDLCGQEQAQQLIDQGTVEIAPLAFMRGRTMSDAFVILDEAQNTTPDQMRMFLTRLGFNGHFVITGDVTQRDVLGPSGLDTARRVLEGMEDVAFVDLDSSDIVRHPLVARIVEAFEKNERHERGKEGFHGSAR